MNNQNNDETKKVSVLKSDNISNEDAKIKKQINKKLLIGGACVLVILGCTIGYGIFNRIKKSDNGINDNIDEADLLVSEKDTYEGLNYTMETEYIEKVGFFYDYSKNKEGSKVEVSTIKVSGLKDTQLQDNINSLLQETAKSLYDQSDVQNENILYTHIYNYTDVYIFNNVLSTLYCKETCDIEGNSKYEYKPVNINLTNLKDINFEDLFISGTDINEILSEDMKTVYASDNFIFSFSPKYIYVPIEQDKVEKISLYDNKEYVAIYKRYANNQKMFEKTYNAIPYVYTTKKFSEKDWYGLVEDNLFIDTHNEINYNDYTENMKTVVEDVYRDAVNKAKNVAYKYPSNRYLAQIIPTIKKEEDNYIVEAKCNIYQLDKQFFIDNIEKFIVASENKGDSEIVKVDYFNNAVMNADEYLKDEVTEKFKKIVDKDGNDVSQKNIDSDSNKIS